MCITLLPGRVLSRIGWNCTCRDDEHCYARQHNRDHEGVNSRRIPDDDRLYMVIVSREGGLGFGEAFCHLTPDIVTGFNLTRETSVVIRKRDMAACSRNLEENNHLDPEYFRDCSRHRCGSAGSFGCIECWEDGNPAGKTLEELSQRKHVTCAGCEQRVREDHTHLFDGKQYCQICARRCAHCRSYYLLTDESHKTFCPNCMEASKPCTICGEPVMAGTGNDEGACRGCLNKYGGACRGCGHHRLLRYGFKKGRYIHQCSQCLPVGVWRWNFHRVPKLYGDNPLRYGVEIEMEVATGDHKWSRHGTDGQDPEKIVRLKDAIEHYKGFDPDKVWLTHDGSLDWGIEVTTAPMPLDMLQAELQNIVPKEALPNRSNCGTHIHISREGFRSPHHMFKFMNFVAQHSVLSTAIGGRAWDTAWAAKYYKTLNRNYRAELAWRSRKGFDTRREFRPQTKYRMFRLTKHTLECRFFAGVSDSARLLSMVEYLDSVIEFTRSRPSKELRKAQYLEYARDRVDSYPNLVSFMDTLSIAHFKEEKEQPPPRKPKADVRPMAHWDAFADPGTVRMVEEELNL